MIDKLMKLRKEKGLSPIEKDAKTGVLEDMRDMAGKMMADKLHGLKKVTVASDDPDALKTGLDKAKAMIGGDDDDNSPEELAESPEMEASEHESEGHDPLPSEELQHMSEDEIDQKLQELMAIKERMQAKKA